MEPPTLENYLPLDEILVPAPEVSDAYLERYIDTIKLNYFKHYIIILTTILLLNYFCVVLHII